MHHSSSSVGVSSGSWSAVSTIQRFGGDEDLVRELATLFLRSAPRQLENLRARMRDDDLHGLGKAAHALKGSVGNFTSDGPVKTALELEKFCELGQKDSALTTFERLEAELSTFLADITAFVGKA